MISRRPFLWCCNVASIVVLTACAPDPADTGWAGSDADQDATDTTRAEILPLPTVAQLRIAGCAGLATSIGTAVAVTGDEFMTNAHVVRGAREVLVSFGDQRELIGTVTSINLRTDLALVRVDLPTPLTAATISPLVEGSDVTSHVFREGADEPLRGRVVDTFTIDIEEPIDDTRYLREAGIIDVQISSGDSGAPVFDDRNRLVGLMFADSRVTPNKSYAVDGVEALALLSERPQPTKDGPDRECA